MSDRTSWCTIARKEDSLERIIPEIAGLGYTAFELWGPHVDRYLHTDRAANLASMLRRHNAQAIAIAVYLDLLSGDWEDAADRYLSTAGHLEAPILRTWLCPRASSALDDLQWQTLVSRARDLVNRASECSIAIAVETHADQPSDTLASTLRLVEDVPGIAVVHDVYALWEHEQQWAASVEALAPWTVHVHAKNARGVRPSKTYTTLAEGDLDWNSIIATLESIGFSGRYSVEYFGADVAEAAASDLEFIRSRTGGQNPLPTPPK